jgi:osmotically-inducible protein OsmY
MKKWLTLGAALLLLGSGLIGCGPKEEGASQPPSVDKAGGKAANVGDTSGTTGTGTETKAADFTSDETITSTVVPAVKKAIEDEASLKDAENKIEIEAKDKKIHLKGEVKNNDAKRKAGEVAETALKTQNPPTEVTVINSLVSKQH